MYFCLTKNVDPNQNHDNTNTPVPPATPTPVAPPPAANQPSQTAGTLPGMDPRIKSAMETVVPTQPVPTTTVQSVDSSAPSSVEPETLGIPSRVATPTTSSPAPTPAASIPGSDTAPQQTQPGFSYRNNQPARKSPRKLKLLFTLSGVFVFLLTATSVGAYAVAYEKVNLGVPAIERPITKLVMGLPFMPKTPRMLLQSAVLAHRKVTRSNLNASIAIKADSFSSLGLNQIDAEIKGGLDTTDPNNVIFSLNASVTKEFNVDLRKKDHMVYFKVNKIPAMVTAFLQVNESKLNGVLENWIAWDTTPLQTEARKYLESNQQPKQTDELISEPIDTLLDENILKAMKVSSESIGGHSTYKIHIDATSSILDALEKNIEAKQSKRSTGTLYQQTAKQKLSDQIQNAKIDIWFDKKEHYVRKFVFAADFTADYGRTSPFMPGVLGAAIGETLAETDTKSKGSMVMALTLNDFGKVITVEVPEKSISPSEFYRLLTSTVDRTGAFGGLDRAAQGANANDAQRRSDIVLLRQALKMYFADNERYPTNLTTLAPTYLAAVPKDPETKANYTYSVKTDGQGFTLSATLAGGQKYTATEKGVRSDLLF